MKPITNFFKDETGYEFSEYAVAAALISFVVVTSFSELSDAIRDVLTTVTASMR
jgi:Flp pilus assembly pilin Flp